MKSLLSQTSAQRHRIQKGHHKQFCKPRQYLDAKYVSAVMKRG